MSSTPKSIPGASSAPPATGTRNSCATTANRSIESDANGNVSSNSPQENWTATEQAQLESLLDRISADKYPPLKRYVHIAAHMPNKSVRDVAFRAKWTAQQRAATKKRKAEEQPAVLKRSKNLRDKSERPKSIFSVRLQPNMGGGADGLPNGNVHGGSGGASQQAGPGPLNSHPHQGHLAQSNSHQYSRHPQSSAGHPAGVAPSAPVPSSSQGGVRSGPTQHSQVQAAPPPMQINTVHCAVQIPQLEDHGADTVGNLGGETEELLEENLQVINQIRNHWAACRIVENGRLLSQLRDNIVKILSSMSSMPGIMAQMPQLPVKLHLELASHVLPVCNSSNQ